MRAIIELFHLFVIILHEKICGKVDVYCKTTDKYIMLEFKTVGNRYEFMSTQYRLVIKYTGWLRCSKVQYFYKVELLNAKDDFTRYYTHMCPQFLHATSYPHRLAIKEHLKLAIDKRVLVI